MLWMRLNKIKCYYIARKHDNDVNDRLEEFCLVPS